MSLPAINPHTSLAQAVGDAHQTSPAIGLPGQAYTSTEFLEQEQQSVFSKNWIFAALATDLPNPGDLFPVTIAGVPIVILRDRHNIIRAFHNICSHRGVQLVSQPCRHSSRLICPYHAWSYDLEGKLLHTPHFGGYWQDNCAGFERAAKDLKPVRCDRWLEMIFVNLSDEAPPLADYVAPISDRWVDYDLQRLRYGGEVRFEFKANWKLAVENFSESYHLPWVHPGLNSYSRMEDHFVFELSDRSFGQGSSLYKPNPVNGKTLPTFPCLSPAKATVAEYVVLFPNTMLGIHPDFFLLLVVNPIGPDRSEERLVFFLVGDEALNPEFQEVRDWVINSWRTINKEDIDIIERLQIGRYSPAFDGGCFSPALEKTVYQFHQLIAQSISKYC